jgi:hypothetical protein
MLFFKKLIIFTLYTVLAITLTGFMISSDAVVARSRFIDATPEVIYAELVDFRKWKAWHPWALLDPTTKHVVKGARSGKGSRLHWSSEKFGSGVVHIVDAQPPGFLLLDLDFDGGKFTGKASFKMVKEGPGIRVIWTEILELGNNPYRRWWGKFLHSVWGEHFEAGLKQLRDICEEAQEKENEDAARAAEAAESGYAEHLLGAPSVLGDQP